MANRKGEFRELFEKLRRQGFSRARVDGEIVSLEGLDKLKKSYRHTIDAVVDRLIAKPSLSERFKEAATRALELEMAPRAS